MYPSPFNPHKHLTPHHTTIHHASVWYLHSLPRPLDPKPLYRLPLASNFPSYLNSSTFSSTILYYKLAATTPYPPKMPTLPPLLNILLALTILTATTLTVLVITPPNSDSKTTSSTTAGTRTIETSTKRTKNPFAPPLQPKTPTETTTKDSIAVFTSPLFLNSCRLAVIGLGIHHAALAFFYPSPPQLICPRQEHLNPSLFTWSWRTSICLGGILIAAPVRLLAFKQLGPNFTFQLAVPGKLVTTGLYVLLLYLTLTPHSRPLSRWR